MPDGNDMEIHTMYNHGFNMSQDDVSTSRPGCAFNDRTGSSGSKRKRGGQRVGEIELIHEVMEYVNDQLRAIVEWPIVMLHNETTVRQEVLRKLRAMLELSRLDRASCSWSLFHSLDNMCSSLRMTNEEKMEFCTILLRED
ncbi:retrotransposon protein [Cucumis melo var. makuwa]|uniref:Retrotransposon protein n=1 Tax=Cucumis melo var. makuwa TaxID=1194695 RepID=A0A5A7V3G0_CUCMM|nr:retrotransposon protein [Cucumis melo var. makuwa]TYK22049.1 retrotransposon protein [Cucumis melo var. makuwa]